jgi:hypothetical protein
MRKAMLTALIIALIAGAAAASIFLQPRRASATIAETSTSVSPFALHLRLDARRLPVSGVVDYTYVFPKL